MLLDDILHRPSHFSDHEEEDDALKEQYNTHKTNPSLEKTNTETKGAQNPRIIPIRSQQPEPKKTVHLWCQQILHFPQP